MAVKADYTHQNAVISTYFNESPMEEVADTIFGILNERAGYLGDVAGANGAPQVWEMTIIKLILMQ